MAGYNQVSTSWTGRYVELKSNISGKTWKGKVKRVSVKDCNGKKPTKRILFEDGREVIAHDHFNFNIKFLEK